MSKQPYERKKAYVENLASIEGINTAMMDWGALLDLINLQIGMDIVLRTLLDMFLNLNLHFNFEEFDFHNLDFRLEFEPELEEVKKARYGMSKYGLSIYDPEQITSMNLERLVWKLRKYAMERHELTYKSADKSLTNLIKNMKDILLEKDVKAEYVDAIEETLSFVEGKFFRIPYVGFTVVGLHKLPETHSQIPIYKIRKPKEWKTELTLQTLTLYESHVGYARVGYSRVVSRFLEIKKSLSDHIKNEIEEFRKRVGVKVVEGRVYVTYPYAPEYAPPLAPYKAEVLFPRTFFLQRVDQMHYEGGSHQIKLQEVINNTKKVLDEEGVIANFRMAYIAFAEELYYLNYQPHKLWRRYKNMFTEDDLIQKYINMGCDKNILLKVKGVVKP